MLFSQSTSAPAFAITISLTNLDHPIDNQSLMSASSLHPGSHIESSATKGTLVMRAARHSFHSSRLTVF